MNALKLKALLVIKGIGYKDLAKALDVSENTVGNRLRGVTDFTRSEIVKLQDYLNLTDQERDEVFFDE